MPNDLPALGWPLRLFLAAMISFIEWQLVADTCLKKSFFPGDERIF